MESGRRHDNEVCIVTGGGSGIGRATSRLFSSLGAHVVIADIDPSGGKVTRDLIEKTGTSATFVEADVSDSDDVRRVVENAVALTGRIDVVVNAAGIMTFTPLVDLPEADWDRVIAVNLRSIFLLCKNALPHMQDGAIVNISSIHAQRTAEHVVPYAATKAAIESLTRGFSVEARPRRVRVNCIAPGGVDTPMMRNNPGVLLSDAVHWARPEQVASVIEFLASDRSGFINGTTVVVDGGQLAKL